jgi:hypothetical protein
MAISLSPGFQRPARPSRPLQIAFHNGAYGNETSASAERKPLSRLALPWVPKMTAIDLLLQDKSAALLT